jgi:hypothetical protein
MGIRQLKIKILMDIIAGNFMEVKNILHKDKFPDGPYFE